MPRSLKYDPVNFCRFLDYHRGCTVCLTSLGPPCMVLTLTFYHQNENSPERRKFELWYFPASIQLPALGWESNLTITQSETSGVYELIDEPAGVKIECIAETWIRLMVHDDLDIPGLDFGDTAE